MDKNLYIEQITNGTEVSSLFLVKRSDLRSKRGEQFVYMTLADRTGTIECKAYGDKAVEAARAVKTGMVYAICVSAKPTQNGELHLFSDTAETLHSLLRGPVALIPGQDTEFIFTPPTSPATHPKSRKLSQALSTATSGSL
ncbi:MAG TPA: OB-fold nucleic acid binding domain-containing protein [Methanocorpusculum sp.]|nr:OB-fold nucleic acid binding domain-containing protein [Methanocorpusculum sp.]